MAVSFLPAVAALLAAAAVPVAAPGTSPLEPTAALRAVDEQFVAAFNRGDVAAIAALYAEDAVLMDPGGPDLFVRGRDAIRKVFSDLFATMRGAEVRLTAVNYEVRGDVAGSVISRCSPRNTAAGISESTK